MKRIILILSALAFVLGIMSVPSISQASTDIVVTATIKNHADNGASQNHWADDTFVRTMKLHNNGDGTYTTTMTDKGTFVTRQGAGSPNYGVPILRTVTGTMISTGSGKITGVLDPNYRDQDGITYDDKFAGAKYPGTGTWALGFFKPGATGHPFSTTYEFIYKTIDETWDESAANDHANTPGAGDITGKLSSLLVILPCKAKNTTTWKVANVRGDRSRTFTWWSYYHGKRSAAHHATVAPYSTVTLRSSTSTTLGIHYYNGYGTSVWSWVHCHA